MKMQIPNRAMRVMMSSTINVKTETFESNLFSPFITMASSQDMNIEHPNGSDGWLPAEPSVVKQEQSDPAAAGYTTPRRSTIRHKKSIRTGSTSRHSSQPRESGIVPLVNGNGTTPAVDEASVEDNLQNRAVSANNNLTPKQRSRIAKSEGQS